MFCLLYAESRKPGMTLIPAVGRRYAANPAVLYVLDPFADAAGAI